MRAHGGDRNTPTLSLVKWIAPLLLVGLAAIGCQNGVAPRQHIAWISVEHVPSGLSISSSYTIRLYADGRVVYEGRSNVKERGVRTKQIPTAPTAAIFRELEAVDFWNLPNTYDTRSLVERRGSFALVEGTVDVRDWVGEFKDWKR